MPTRVVLDESPSAIQRQRSARGEFAASGRRLGRPFRSTLLRSVIESTTNISEQPAAGGAAAADLFGDAADVRASPRLAGYLYIMIASVVMMASIAQFYRNDQIGDDFLKSLGLKAGHEFITVGGSRIYYWKFIGAFVVACIGTVTSLILIVAHFDTFFFPRFWRKAFQDGSKIERNILIVNCIFWAIAVHICTSSFSIGATQANVYFTTWIAFASAAKAYDVWRLCADLPNLSDFMARRRMTTVFNWVWTMCFTVVTASAITDMFVNREHIVFYFEGVPRRPSIEMWIQGLSIAWSSALASGLAIMAKIMWKNWTLPWVYFEGFVVAAFVATYTYICTTYTGISGPFSGPSNAYFGVWGVFFGSLITFGTWLRENRGVQELRRFPSFRRTSTPNNRRGGREQARRGSRE